jgi:hypothetical protein
MTLASKLWRAYAMEYVDYKNNAVSEFAIEDGND